MHYFINVITELRNNDNFWSEHKEITDNVAIISSKQISDDYSICTGSWFFNSCKILSDIQDFIDCGSVSELFYCPEKTHAGIDIQDECGWDLDSFSERFHTTHRQTRRLFNLYAENEDDWYSSNSHFFQLCADVLNIIQDKADYVVNEYEIVNAYDGDEETIYMLYDASNPEVKNLNFDFILGVLSGDIVEVNCYDENDNTISVKYVDREWLSRVDSLEGDDEFFLEYSNLLHIPNLNAYNTCITVY